MNSIKLHMYQERLLRRRQQIFSTLGHLAAEIKTTSGQRHFDWVDQAWDESENRLLDRLSNTYLEEMARIRIALEKIHSGDYGFCSACHTPIESKRLNAFPETLFCFSCQEIREELENVSSKGSVPELHRS